MSKVNISIGEFSFLTDLIAQPNGILRAKNILNEVFVEFWMSERFQMCAEEDKSEYISLHEEMQGVVDMIYISQNANAALDSLESARKQLASKRTR